MSVSRESNKVGNGRLGDETIDQLVQKYLSEARQKRYNDWRREARNRRLVYILTIAEVILGAVLTLSFISLTLPARLIGALGVAVIIAAASRRGFKPDVKYSQATARKNFLNQGIRNTLNEQAAINGMISALESLKEKEEGADDERAKREHEIAERKQALLDKLTKLLNDHEKLWEKSQESEWQE